MRKIYAFEIIKIIKDICRINSSVRTSRIKQIVGCKRKKQTCFSPFRITVAPLLTIFLPVTVWCALLSLSITSETLSKGKFSHKALNSDCVDMTVMLLTLPCVERLTCVSRGILSRTSIVILILCLQHASQ